ncbi:MAG: ribosome biogenesis GTPase YlqF [Lachnospiraceae bacterium]|nr:ribosome biogenesis GTPase YlqF [Lachnospiraceae bacterium]
MTKARRMMEEQLSSVEMVVELRDARVVRASGNPDIETLCRRKKRLLVLNKSDLADERETKRWAERFRAQGIETVTFNALKKNEAAKITDAMRRLMEERIKKDAARGMTPMIRAMIAGIPNVGKSTLINCLAKKALTKTANKPGVTRGKQWLTIDESVRVLDTPGILWPRFEDARTGEHLAMIGSLNDVNLDLESLAVSLIRRLEILYPGAMPAFFEYAEEEVQEIAEEETGGLREAAVLYLIARRRGALRKGARPDYEKASSILLTEFRGGRLGRITLEKAEEQ